MPKILLQRMLHALCCSGAEFYYPEKTVRAENIIRELPVQKKEKCGGFTRDIPGGRYFRPEPEGDHPYYPPECHPSHVEIIMPVDGIVDFFINDHWQQLTKECVYILMPNTIHTERHFQYKPYTLFWLMGLPSSLTLHRTAYSPSCGYTQSACRIVISPPMASQLWKCAFETPENDVHYFSLLVQCLDFAVANNLADSRTADYHDAVLFQIRKYLDGNFSRPIDLVELAEMAHCSPVHLNRLFSAQFGKTVHRYLVDLRMTEAIKKLQAGFTPGEAAHTSGFPDQRYFSRFFRKRTGFTPSAFRQKTIFLSNAR